MYIYGSVAVYGIGADEQPVFLDAEGIRNGSSVDFVLHIPL